MRRFWGTGDWRYQTFLVALSVGFFFAALYMLTGSGTPQPLYPEWAFGSDSYREVLNGTSDTDSGIRHLLYVVVATPLYWLGTALFGSANAVDGLTRAMVFPGALFGALNTYVAGLLFFRCAQSTFPAAAFSMIYAYSSSNLFFSAFPDIYIATGLTSSLFLLLMFDGFDRHSTKSVAVFNAVISYMSPQQIFLAIIPGFRRLLEVLAGTRRFRDLVVWTMIYTAILIAVFVIPYLIYLELFGPGWIFPRAYLGFIGEPENVTNFAYFLIGLEHYLIYGIIAPPIDWRIYVDGILSVLSAAPYIWWAFLAVYGILVLGALYGALSRRIWLFGYFWPICAYSAWFMAFFVFFNPTEPFLAAHGLVLPWLLIVQAGYLNLTGRIWPIILSLVGIVTLANSAILTVFLRSFL
ncbi:MAG: hypothetical protein HKP29_01385 [Silicimonas sp.]|nr:hypothetical protein [Silicimonas sp.]